MRQLAEFSHGSEVETFADFLYLHQIETTQQWEEGGKWLLWVHDDDHLEEANRWLAEFRKNPQATIFQEAVPRARWIRAQQRKEELKSRHHNVDVRTRWNASNFQIGRLTLALIVISCGISLLSGLGSQRNIVEFFSITDYNITGGYMEYRIGLQDILRGQVWRLITPIFLHFSFLHLLFNMLWLKDLGSAIEARLGALTLAFQVLVIGIFSNLAQYAVSGPSFGGMSGVVYGLLGFLWIRGHYDRSFGLLLNKGIVLWMLIWFVLCLTGMMGSVANTAHGAGLALGMLWGYISSKAWKRRSL